MMTIPCLKVARKRRYTSGQSYTSRRAADLVGRVPDANWLLPCRRLLLIPRIALRIMPQNLQSFSTGKSVVTHICIHFAYLSLMGVLLHALIRSPALFPVPIDSPLESEQIFFQRKLDRVYTLIFRSFVSSNIFVDNPPIKLPGYKSWIKIYI